ncbi:hypothetical protein KIPB_007161, partial [Kipferlia bialata]|eukprot:g7161.t1
MTLAKIQDLLHQLPSSLEELSHVLSALPTFHLYEAFLRVAE